MTMGKKTIILGLTGGIAVYKSADLCSKLVAQGYEVHVVMTENARKLISERIFLTLSRNPVIFDLFSAPEWKPEHVDLAEKADLLLVAPCTANFIGKYANGIADDALTTVAVTHRKKVLLAPAMNHWMWDHPILQMNLQKLASIGVQFIGPDAGPLACGVDGYGRMSEPADILRAIKLALDESDNEKES